MGGKKKKERGKKTTIISRQKGKTRTEKKMAKNNSGVKSVLFTLYLWKYCITTAAVQNILRSFEKKAETERGNENTNTKKRAKIAKDKKYKFTKRDGKGREGGSTAMGAVTQGAV